MPFADRDGVRLFYTDGGSGDPPLLLVHGWACDHTHWRRQAPAFRRRHRVVAVDLRGHGRSSKPRQHYALEVFADDLAWLCEGLGLSKPVVVGHSMGGSVVLVLAARHRDLPRAVVVVDAPLAPLPPEDMARLWKVTERLETPSYRRVAEGLIERMFTPSSDPVLKARVSGQMLATPQHVMASALRHSLEGDRLGSAAAMRVPALLVAASTSLDGLSTSPRLPRWQFAQVVGSGHFVQLEVADQFNAMLRRFLEGIEGAST